MYAFLGSVSILCIEILGALAPKSPDKIYVKLSEVLSEPHLTLPER